MSIGLRVGRLSRWFGLALIALLVMAAGARAAGEWKIAEQTMTGLEAPEASIFGTASEKFKLAVAWYGSEIECAALATEAPTKIFPGGTSEAILKLSSCQVFGPPFVSETCKLVEPIELKVVGELLLHSGKTYELFKAASGESLGTIKFKEGTECPLPLSNELKGTFVGETEAGERIEQPLSLNSTIEALFGGDGLSFGTHPATLKGKSTWALAAGYKGLKWAAVGEKSKEEVELEKEQLEHEAKLHEEELEHEAELEHEEELHEEKLHKEELEHAKELSGSGKYVLLLNGSPVNLLNLTLEGLHGYMTASNGLKILCEGATGTAHVVNSGGVSVTVSSSAVFTGCEWVGAEQCIISDEFENPGELHTEATGVVSMTESNYAITATSAEFGTIYTEGAFCTIPEEEGISGTLSVNLAKASAEANTTVKTGSLKADNLKLGAVKVTELLSELHFRDTNPSVTWAIHL